MSYYDLEDEHHTPREQFNGLQSIIKLLVVLFAGLLMLAMVIGGFASLCTSVASGQDVTPTVRYSVKVVDAQYSPVMAIKPNRPYWLILTAKDLRPEGTYVATFGNFAGQERNLDRGVFAAYVFIQYDQAFKPDMKRSAQFRNSYSNGTVATDDANGFMVGGFGGLGPGTGSTEVEVVRIPVMSADVFKTSTAFAKPSIAGLKMPHYQTLVYANYAANPPEFRSEVFPAEIVLEAAVVSLQP